MNMAVSPEVPSRVRQLADELAHAQPMRRGSLSDRTIRCGKAGCACANNPKARHGPYHSLTQAVEGKTRSRFLSEEQAAVARQQIATGREFRGHVDAYWEACEQWADAQLGPTPAAPAEEAQTKGTQRSFIPTSSRSSTRSMAATRRRVRAYWVLCIWSEPTISVQNAKADSARAIMRYGWDCFRSHPGFCG